MPFTRFLQVVENCDKFPYRLDDSVDSELSGIRPIVLYGQVIGHVQPRVLPALVAYNDAQPSPPPFIITSDNIQFNTWVDTFEKRTKVVKQLMDTWRDAKVMKALAGIYINEPFLPSVFWQTQKRIRMERRALPGLR